ncbi:hypothetical protein HanIR_Chr03g0149261 [Helianthus annuus]|nr:hypothetical protein HanIR_Chr03g0149261 [Helianthus annuus]
MHNMSKMNYLKKLLEQCGVVYVPFHYENPTSFQQRLTSSFKGRIVIIVKVI